ncbi:outer membrane protein 25b [Brucella ceti M644/93/1]|uniref:Outer membrane protein 25b n=1 Tax=Brucella ceti M644/93/1 TaxID=520459 RepID=A0ABM9ZDZ6_9HYPH|nr:outer membrane protein 25b [Brucella ceti M13/05/1]EEX98006.1 outer membrane protein 25b [Brucella ceti M644/93/1]
MHQLSFSLLRLAQRLLTPSLNRNLHRLLLLRPSPGMAPISAARSVMGWGRSTLSDEDTSIRVKPDGFLGGLYAGYNFDMGNNFVLGVDGDITYNDLDASHSDTDPDLDLTTGVDSKLRWSGAVRARMGVAMDRWMPYIAGGVAFGNVKNSVSLTDGIESIGVSQSKTMTGWAAGAGVDYAATDNVIVRLEYRYTDYGHKDFSVVDGDLSVEARNKFKTHDIRLGVAYKF